MPFHQKDCQNINQNIDLFSFDKQTVQLIITEVIHLKTNLFELISEWNHHENQMKGYFHGKTVVPESILKKYQDYVSNIKYNLVTITTRINETKEEMKQMQAEIDRKARCEKKMKMELECVRKLLKEAKNDAEWEKNHREIVEQEKNSMALNYKKLAQTFELSLIVSDLLWKATQNQDTLNMIITHDDTFKHFMSKSIVLLDNFVKSFLTESQNVSLITSICGIISNVAASPIGRDMLIKWIHTIALIKLLFSIMKEENYQITSELKYNCLLALFNYSLDPNGSFNLLSHLDGLIHVLCSTATKFNDNQDFRVISIQLTRSLIYDQDPELIKKLKYSFPLTEFQKLMRDPHPKIRQNANELLNVIGLILDAEW